MEIKQEIKLNAFEQMIKDVAGCNATEAKRLFNHSENWAGVDWSEITEAQLKREIKFWLLEINDPRFQDGE